MDAFINVDMIGIYAVLAKSITMIARNDKDRIIQDALPIKFIQNLLDMMIDICD